MVFVPLRGKIKCKAIESRKNYALKTTDAIIEATAMEWDYLLASAGLHFKKLNGLK